MAGSDKPRLGELLRMLGAGSAAKTGKTVVDTQRKKKKKLDGIMDEIRSTRGK